MYTAQHDLLMWILCFYLSNLIYLYNLAAWTYISMLAVTNDSRIYNLIIRRYYACIGDLHLKCHYRVQRISPINIKSEIKFFNCDFINLIYI